MINRIYQFADIPLSLAKQAIFFDQSTEWQGEIGNFTHNYKKYGSGHRFVHSPTTLSFSGELVFDGTLHPSFLEQRLRSSVGFPDTLICYVLPREYPPQFDMCQPCMYCEGCDIIWVSVPAILTNVSSDKSNWESGVKITLTFTLLDFFSPLNKLLWVHNGSVYTSYLEKPTPETVEEALDSISCWPTCNSIFADCVACRFFSKNNYNIFDIAYNPVIWQAFGDDGCGQAEYCFVQEPVSLSFDVSSLIIESDWKTIDYSIWGALPSSIYALQFVTTELDDSDTTYDGFIGSDSTSEFSLTVRYAEGTKIREETTILDISAISTKLIADTGEQITTGDFIIFGNVSVHQDGEFYRPIFIYRPSTGLILETHPPITYTSFSPGQLYPTKNKVIIRSPYNAYTSNGEPVEPGPSYRAPVFDFSYIHWFRRV